MCSAPCSNSGIQADGGSAFPSRNLPCHFIQVRGAGEESPGEVSMGHACRQGAYVPPDFSGAEQYSRERNVYEAVCNEKQLKMSVSPQERHC